MNQHPELIYADGSANRYEISANRLSYIPVKPEESSTGMYSGGEPATISLTQAEYLKLKDLFDQAMAQTEEHITDRIKTSGLVVIGDKQIILKPGSPTMLQIEDTLKSLLGK
ncbi:MAG: hypothetical protein KIT62_17580 [Cyclobacteriaceae bacterium]|nr:hypothetical protein [Cyclobacteriaceae bacterium]